MPLIFSLVLAAVGPAASGPHPFRHYRHYGHAHAPADAGPQATATDAGGESFVKNGRRYYWFLRGGRRAYSSHPPAGYQPVAGPSPAGAATAGPVSGGLADLDEPLSRAEQAAQTARARQAQARLALLEHRIGRLRHLERLRAHPDIPPKKRR